MQEEKHHPSDLVTRPSRPVPTEFTPSRKKRKGSLAWQPRRSATSGIKGYNAGVNGHKAAEVLALEASAPSSCTTLRPTGRRTSSSSA